MLSELHHIEAVQSGTRRLQSQQTVDKSFESALPFHKSRRIYEYASL